MSFVLKERKFEQGETIVNEKSEAHCYWDNPLFIIKEAFATIIILGVYALGHRLVFIATITFKASKSAFVTHICLQRPSWQATSPLPRNLRQRRSSKIFQYYLAKFWTIPPPHDNS